MAHQTDLLGQAKTIGLDYRFSMVVALSLVLLVGMLGPWIAIFLATGVTRWIYVAIVLVSLAVFLRGAIEIRVHLSCVCWYPVVLLLFNYILWRATILTYVQRGIRWRDTFYPLAELKANKV